jgi:hypothetical protein
MPKMLTNRTTYVLAPSPNLDYVKAELVAHREPFTDPKTVLFGAGVEQLLARLATVDPIKDDGQEQIFFLPSYSCQEPIQSSLLELLQEVVSIDQDFTELFEDLSKGIRSSRIIVATALLFDAEMPQTLSKWIWDEPGVDSVLVVDVISIEDMPDC